jgi:hypothetical protein
MQVEYFCSHAPDFLGDIFDYLGEETPKLGRYWMDTAEFAGEVESARISLAEGESGLDARQIGGPALAGTIGLAHVPRFVLVEKGAVEVGWLFNIKLHHTMAAPNHLRQELHGRCWIMSGSVGHPVAFKVYLDRLETVDDLAEVISFYYVYDEQPYANRIEMASTGLAALFFSIRPDLTHEYDSAITHGKMIRP